MNFQDKDQDENIEKSANSKQKGPRIKSGVVSLESGATYAGQWLKEKRDGYGV